jgi:hypothetical protein
MNLIAMLVLMGAPRALVPPPPPPPIEEQVQQAPTPPPPSEDYEATLSPYGTWIWVDGLGRVWRPAPGFVQFGWEPFRYGRWQLSAGYGWVWYPNRPVIVVRPAPYRYYRWGPPPHRSHRYGRRWR